MSRLNSGIRFWRCAIVLIVVLSGLLWLGVLLYLIPERQPSKRFGFRPTRFLDLIDVYKELLGLGESQLIKAVAITDAD